MKYTLKSNGSPKKMPKKSVLRAVLGTMIARRISV
jgi:hypothetical protein